MSDDFFDAFGDEIQVDWSKVTENDIQKMLEKLDNQEASRIFDELKTVIEQNNKKKAIAKSVMTAIEVLGKLGAKFI